VNFGSVAQEVDLKVSFDDLKSYKTTVLMDPGDSPLTKEDIAALWYSPESIEFAKTNELSAQLKKNTNLFIIPVVETVSKGVTNYRLVLVQGKSTMTLGTNLDADGFYMISLANLDIIAAIYVDPAKIKTPFLRCYMSALSSLVSKYVQYESKEQLEEYLKMNYWYEGMKRVVFEEQDVDSLIRDKALFSSIFKNGTTAADSVIYKNIARPQRDPNDLYAEILVVNKKGGSFEVHRFFFSPVLGLIYHEFEGSDKRKDIKFTKRDIYNYGKVDVNGKNRN